MTLIKFSGFPARYGAALPGAISPWTVDLSAHEYGQSAALSRTTGLAFGALGARPAMKPRDVAAAMGPWSATAAMTPVATADARSLAVNGQLTEDRKQYAIRVNADGDGAAGLYPEREPA